MADPYLTSLEQQYKLPPGILEATRIVETGGNPSQVSKAGAIGPFQFMPATAKALGIDPRNPKQAAEGAARLWAENLRATNGDIDTAARMYQGGPDRSKWGAANAAYPGQILAALQKQSTPSPQPQDDYERALSGSASPPQAEDQFEKALIGDKGAPNGSVPQQPVSPVPIPNGNSGSDNNGNSDSGNYPNAVAAPPVGNQGAGTPGAPASGTGSGGQQALDFAQGGVQGFSTVPDTAWSAVDWAARKLGIDPNAIAQGGDNAKSHMFDWLAPYPLAGALAALDNSKPTDSAAYKLGKFLGEGAATAPIAELTPFGDSTFARRMGNYMLQGAGAGAATSEGNDVLSRAGYGALLAPAVGAGVEGVLSPALTWAASKAKPIIDPAVEKLAQAIKSRGSSFDEPAAAMDLPPALKAVVKPPVADQGARDAAFLAQEQAAHPDELVGIVHADEPTAAPFTKPDGSIDWEAAAAADKAAAQPPSALAEALQQRAGRRGIESVTEAPTKVTQDAAALTQQGVPADQALNEATIRYIGAEPTVATVTRDPVAVRAEREGAKLNTPEGIALNERAAQNNAAAHQTIQDTIDGYGGMPAQGDAGRQAAEALAQASDTAKAKVSEAYTAARAQDGDQRASIDGLQELLATPQFKAPTTPEGKQLANGLRAQLAAMAKANGGQFSPDEIEQLIQEANRAYNPMGGGANGMIGDVKAALNDALDQFDKAGPAFKQARALHRQWAQQYDNPAGVRNLIKRDAQGNFLNEGNWRQTTDRLIGTSNDKNFGQVVAQLKAIGANDAINGLKSEIVQRAYDAAKGGGAADQFNNQTLSGMRWANALDRMGMPTLKAVFSPEEITHLSTVGRGLRLINDANPRANINYSNTDAASANRHLAEALKARGKAAQPHPVKKAIGNAAKIGAHAVAGHALPGAGNAMVAGISEGVGAASRKGAESKAASQLADAINLSLDPNAARAAEAARIRQFEVAERRKALSAAIASRAAAASGAQAENRSR